MIVPTLFVAVNIAWNTRETREEFIHNVAVFFWICANSIWMIGEFFFDDSTRPFALIFFILGLLTLASHYLPKWWRLLVDNDEDGRPAKDRPTTPAQG